MAKILTVHGTYVTSNSDAMPPRCLSDWWWEKSTFAEELKKLVKHETSEVEIEAFRWNGENSALSRAQASEDLYKKMEQYEKDRVTYTLIGHSHGGSVIEGALNVGARQEDELPHMKSWITIGTPFIRREIQTNPIMRFTPFLQIIMVMILTLPLYYFFPIIVQYTQNQHQSDQISSHAATKAINHDNTEKGDGRNEQVAAVTSIIILVLVYLLWYSLSLYLLKRGEKQRAKYAEAHYKSRWTGFLHKKDEATNGLKALSKQNIKIFTPDSFKNQYSAALILIMGPILFYLELTRAQVRPSALIERIEIQYIDPYLHSINTWVGSTNVAQITYDSIFVFAVIPSVILMVTEVLAPWCSQLTSCILNPMLTKGARNYGFGNDNIKAPNTSTTNSPPWITDIFPQLPEMIALQMEEASEENVITTILNVRSALLPSECEQGETTNFWEHLLSAKGLIHTSYFNNQSFRQLIADVIAEKEGFSPKDEIHPAQFFPCPIPAHSTQES